MFSKELQYSKLTYNTYEKVTIKKMWANKY